VRQQVLNNPAMLASLNQQAPQLAAAINDPNRFRDEFLRMEHEADRARREHEERVNRLNMDPMDVQAQKEIEEMIRQEQVMENVQHALDHNPEGECLFPLRLQATY
jgi:DNA damage-inducible protein 1